MELATEIAVSTMARAVRAPRGPPSKNPRGPWNHCYYATDYGNILSQVKKNLGGLNLLKNNLFVSKAEVHALVGSIPTLHRKVGSFKLFKEEVIKYAIRSSNML